MFWIAPKSSSRIKALSSLCLGYFPPLVASVAQQLHDGCNCMKENSGELGKFFCLKMDLDWSDGEEGSL